MLATCQNCPQTQISPALWTPVIYHSLLGNSITNRSIGFAPKSENSYIDMCATYKCAFVFCLLLRLLDCLTIYLFLS